MQNRERKFDQEPLICAKVADSSSHFDFKPLGKFSILDDSGRPILEHLSNQHTWRITFDQYQAPEFVFFVQIDRLTVFASAENTVEKLSDLNCPLHIESLGHEFFIGGQKIGDNKSFLIQAGPFESENEAMMCLNNLPHGYEGECIRKPVGEPDFLIEAFDVELDQHIRTKSALSVISEDKGRGITLLNVCVDEGFDREEKKHRTLLSPLRFQVNVEGRLIALSDISLENYLHHVLRAEMGNSFHKEALKSQAVASRSWALANLGLCHPDEPFDVCCEPHCQLFCGKEAPPEIIVDAVKETRGEVLYWNDQVCEAVSTPVCGGHTEDAILAHIEPHVSYLKGKKDAKKSGDTLKTEESIAFWVSSKPDVFCNPKIQKRHPDKVNARSFRWEVNYARVELEEILFEKTGVEIGLLFDIIPRKRGVSGRLIELEVIGSYRNLTLKGELNIRQALSKTTLYSSCFIVELDMGDDGVPLEISLVGAGRGHGVGLCQAGASAMAAENRSYHEILKHYYSDIEIKKIY